ncbi:hypothetical protein RFI_24984, partial [Reticulomyxa filosa]
GGCGSSFLFFNFVMFVFSNKQQRVHYCLSVELKWRVMSCNRKCIKVSIKDYLGVELDEWDANATAGDKETIGKGISRAKVRITMLAFEILFAIYSSITSIGPPMSQFQSNDFAVGETAKFNEHHFANAIVFGLCKLDLTQVAVIWPWLRKDIGRVVDESKAHSTDENQTDNPVASLQPLPMVASSSQFCFINQRFYVSEKIEACNDFFPKTPKYLLREQQNNDQNTHAKKKLAKLKKICKFLNSISSNYCKTLQLIRKKIILVQFIANTFAKKVVIVRIEDEFTILKSK